MVYLRKPMADELAMKGRGARGNISHRFSVETIERDNVFAVQPKQHNTEVRFELAKTIITKNNSPDIPFNYSINPYRGCEHGCSYCYARASHAYLELSPGLDFETVLYAKQNAAELLQIELASKSYRCDSIALGNNTDAYQPIERRLKITRGILQTFERVRHPVSIVTKSALILRDLDLLTSLAQDNLVHVAISLTSLDHSLASKMEPRAASPSKRLQVIERLSQAGVPVSALIAPIIPAINDNEIEDLVVAAQQRGVCSANFVMLRLPHEVKDVFQDWLQVYFPLRKDKVTNKLRSMFGGEMYRSQFGARMRGSGEYASLIHARFKLACKKVGLSNQFIELRKDLFRPDLLQADQLSLF